MNDLAPHKLLKDLVAIPSVSHLSNREIIAFIRSVLDPLGWHLRHIGYCDAAGIEKINLLASPAPIEAESPHFELAVVCHTDTVPYSADWPTATRLQQIDGALHGCGACDVKGFLACMLSAAARVDPSTLVHPLAFVFTADEEIGCRGARLLVEGQALHSRYAIVGEPTSLVPAYAGKGYGLARVTVHGQSAHSAYPQQGASAILAAARMLTKIDDLAIRLQEDRDDSFFPPYTTFNIGEIHGGTAKNIIPAECTFLLEWRPAPKQSFDAVLVPLRAIASGMSAEFDHKIQIDIDILRRDAGFSISQTSRVLKALLTHPDTSVKTIAFGTEAPWMTRLGAEAVVFGPGSIETAHSPRECVPIDELTCCTEILCRAIQQLCGD